MLSSSSNGGGYIFLYLLECRQSIRLESKLCGILTYEGRRRLNSTQSAPDYSRCQIQLFPLSCDAHKHLVEIWRGTLCATRRRGKFELNNVSRCACFASTVTRRQQNAIGSVPKLLLTKSNPYRFQSVQRDLFEWKHRQNLCVSVGKRK